MRGGILGFVVREKRTEGDSIEVCKGNFRLGYRFWY